MARPQRPRQGEALLAPFRVLAAGGTILLEEGGLAPGPSWGRRGPEAAVELLATGAALDAVELAYSATMQALASAVEAIHLVDRGRLAAIQATAARRRPTSRD